jgi:hypothetical protein
MNKTLGAACVLILAQTTWAQALRADGYCRDGLPHGAYELRDASGQMRTAGAFAKGKRTGSFIFWSSTGARVAQLPFEDDRLAGTLAFWHPPPAAGKAMEPRRKLEATYVAGRLSGMKRSWYADGRVRTEFRYNAGVLAEARAFDQAGKPLSEIQAAALAARDAADDDALLATLEAMVRAHPPRCDDGAERDETAPPRGG